MKKTSFKLKVAIFFGYNGSNFHGLQKASTNHPTIEAALEKALFDCGLISEQNFGALHKSGWGRGSRTDKGVHASLNTIKCKLSVSEKFLSHSTNKETALEAVDKKAFKKRLDYARIVGEVNGRLPREIRLFAIRLVTKNFDVKNSARSRRYEYILPFSLLECAQNEGRSQAEVLGRLNLLLARYKGCRNFHNFTKKGDPGVKSNERFIIDVRAEFFEPSHFSFSPQKKYVIVYLHGQSFLYHQIRKMVGAVVQIMQLGLEDAFLEEAFGKQPAKIWLAPSEGLLLDRVF